MLINSAVFFTESSFWSDYFNSMSITEKFKLRSNAAGHDIASGLDAFFSRDEKIKY